MSEFKKESIEEAAKRYCAEKQNEYDSSTRSFTDGAKWKQQQINCELSELKSQRDEMLAMLENYDHYTKKEIQQLIKKVKNE